MTKTNLVNAVSRAAALVLDYIVINMVVIISSFAVFLFNGATGNPSSWLENAGRYTFLVAILTWAFKSFLEAKYGTTAGKNLAGLRVVSKNPAWWVAPIRNAWLLFPLVELAGSSTVLNYVYDVVAIALFLFIAFRGQHLFDMLTKTTVIRRRNGDGYLTSN